MNKLKIGIVGAGRIGNVHAESITYHIPEAEVVMVTDVIEANAKKLAERFGVPKSRISLVSGESSRLKTFEIPDP